MPETTIRPGDDPTLPNALPDLDVLDDPTRVSVTDVTRVHDDADHCAADTAGRVAVGVTNDAGAVLPAVHREQPVAMLPNATVEPGDDWVAVGRRTVERVTGASFEIDGVEHVRRVTHVAAGESDPHAETVNAIFRASATGDPAGDLGLDENDHWDAKWFDEVPSSMVSDDLAVADVALFTD